jgi:hypothetical protein
MVSWEQQGPETMRVSHGTRIPAKRGNMPGSFVKKGQKIIFKAARA